MNSYHYHLFLAQQKRKANDRPAASLEYQKALAIFPGNVQLKEEFNAYSNPKGERKSGNAEIDRHSPGAVEYQKG